MINKNKLMGKIKEHAMSVAELAEMIGVSKSTFYRILSNDGESITIAHINAMQEIFKLSKHDVLEIFFCIERSKNGKVMG